MYTKTKMPGALRDRHFYVVSHRAPQISRPSRITIPPKAIKNPISIAIRPPEKKYIP